jgi:transitional endoplasmic reticulum ATPase
MSSSDPSAASSLTVAEAPRKDAGRGMVRIAPTDLEALGVEIGDIVALEGDRRALAKALPLPPDARGGHHVQMDGVLRENAGVGVHGAVEVHPIEAPPARRVVLQPLDAALSDRDLDDLGRRIDGRPVQPGHRVRVALLGDAADFRVETARPRGPVHITPDTTLVVSEAPDAPAAAAGRRTYEDIGGLGPQVRQVREMIELPLRAPGVFQRLGIDPPTGVLLSGPPGCGKTLLARTVAAETDAAFFSISGPEVVRKMYGESEAQLRQVFNEAADAAPSIVFLDEIDALAPRREAVEGDVEKRIVATLLTLMDGLEPRTGVIVIAATNRPNAVDPALRRAGRFDREVAIPIPDREARREILEVHSRGMPLTEAVSLDARADTTHGFVGADLEALCREAAMAALRRALPDFGLGRDRLSTARLRDIEVGPQDFDTAQREVQASALRAVFTEVPNVHWDDIGGLETVKARLQEAVEWPLRHAALFEAAQVRPARGLLLAGPPGTGKTMLARALATETEANFLSVKGPELVSKYVGESEQKVREIFRKAREAAPCIVFFDEIDALAPARGGASDSGVAERVLAQFLVEMDGLEALRDVVVVAATNRPDRLDPALLRPGRFDRTLEVPRPGPEARRAILAVHLRDKPTAPALALDALVPRTDGFSGADLAAVCRRAALRALRPVAHRADAGEAPAAPDAIVLQPRHLEAAIEAVRPHTAHDS